LEEPETYSATASRSQSMFRSLTSVCWNDANGNTTVPSSATLTITYRTTSAVAASTTIGMSQAGSFFIATWGSGVAALGNANYSITAPGQATATTGTLRLTNHP